MPAPIPFKGRHARSRPPLDDGMYRSALVNFLRRLEQYFGFWNHKLAVVPSMSVGSPAATVVESLPRPMLGNELIGSLLT
jgi:hypothetical protein